MRLHNEPPETTASHGDMESQNVKQALKSLAFLVTDVTKILADLVDDSVRYLEKNAVASTRAKADAIRKDADTVRQLFEKVL